jgi:hypothetical protein
MIRPRRKPGDVVYRCTLCDAGWTQGGLAEALAHYETHYSDVVCGVSGVGLGAPATRQTSGGVTESLSTKESM